ncbi:hypothetical protein ACQ4PT_057961 [Festuca glaucescens]
MTRCVTRRRRTLPGDERRTLARRRLSLGWWTLLRPPPTKQPRPQRRKRKATHGQRIPKIDRSSTTGTHLATIYLPLQCPSTSRPIDDDHQDAEALSFFFFPYLYGTRAPHQAQQQRQQKQPRSCPIQKDNDHVVLHLGHFVPGRRAVREPQGGGEEAALRGPVRGAGRHRQAQHRQARAAEPGSLPHARRVLSVQARRVPRPSTPRIRDRHLHARRGLHPPGLLRTQGHHQDGGCSVDDGGPRHRALGDAGVRRRAEGPTALDQPRRQGQDDRAAVPGAAEQGHKLCVAGRRRGADHRRGGLRGAVAGVHADADHVHMDFTMQPGSQLHQPIPAGWNAFVYIIEGEGVFGREKAAPTAAHHCLVLGADGDGLSVWNRSGAPLRFALAAGQPLKEPVVQHGPFVMNTRAEIQQAMEDYYHGRNGFEKAKQWSSA